MTTRDIEMQPADDTPPPGLSRYYETHDNGGRPFRVGLHNDTELGDVVTVATEGGDEVNGDITWNPPFYRGLACQMFVGRSPRCRMTEFSGGHGPRFDGNSILFRVREHSGAPTLDYVHIGACIIKFRALAPIVRFSSPVGNSDVPYPYAVDAADNVYLLIEDVILLNTGAHEHYCEYDDPYEYYYDASLMSPDRGVIPTKNPLEPHPNICALFGGADDLTLRYNPFAGAKYDRLVEHFGPVSIEIPGQVRVSLSKQNWIDLMRDFGNIRRFMALEHAQLHCSAVDATRGRHAAALTHTRVQMGISDPALPLWIELHGD